MSSTRTASGRPLEALGQDLRYAVRMLRRSPVLTGVALLSLAFGIGTNTAIFSVVDALLLQNLPVVNAERLVVIQRTGQDGGETPLFSYRDFRALRDGQDRAKVFALTRDFAAVVHPLGALANAPGEKPAGGDEDAPETAVSQLVSGNFFSSLGVQAVAGRTFGPDEDKTPGTNPVGVISQGFWERRFARDPRVIGGVVSVNGTPVTIVGVLPRAFYGVFVDLSPDLYLPVMMRDAVHYSGNTNIDGPEHPGGVWEQPHDHWLELMARRSAGIEQLQARAILELIYHQQLATEVADLTDPGDRREALAQHLKLTGGAHGLSELRDRLTEPLLILMAVAALVLLIACGNVANLLLVQADRRRKEMAVRLGVGAARGRLIRQLLTESLLLAGVGALLGMLFAVWGSRLLYVLVARPQIPIQLAGALDLRRLAFAIGVAVATGALFGLAPALLATRVDLASTLKSAARTVSGSQTGHPGRRVSLGRLLVAAQIALSLVLLIGAGLFARSLRNLLDVRTGFEVDGLVEAWVNPRLLGWSDPQLLDLYRRLTEGVRSTPGVASATMSLSGLLGGHTRSSDLAVAGFDPHRPGMGNLLLANESLVEPGYFATVGIPLVEGRGLEPRDRDKAPKVAVINETMAHRFFPGRSAVGQYFGFGGPEHAHDIQIVGVAKDSVYNSVREKTPAMVYRSVDQAPEVLRSILVRTTPGSQSAVMGRLRRAVAAVEPRLAVFEISPMSQVLDRTVGRERAITKLMSFFSALALLLAAIGLYGVMSYAVARRTNEIGVRMALGARRSTVLQLVFVESFRLVAVGAAAGLLGAFALSRFAASQLFGLEAHDPLTLVGATVLLMVLAMVAGYLPARRAAATNPMAALRHE